MASCFTLLVTVCGVMSATGSEQLTLSTEEKSWSEAKDACVRNGSSLVTTDDTFNGSVTSVWTSQRTFLSGWVANQGCHTGNLTDIEGKNVTSPKVGRCQLYCQGSEYFTLQDSVCKCLNTSAVTQLNRTLDSNCDVTCGEGHDNGTKCGGGNEHVVSLYRISGFERHVKRQIICENEPGNVTCPSPTVISITYANYGLTKVIESCKSNKVITPDTNCRHPLSTDMIRKLCNRKQTCTVTPTNDLFGSDPCGWTTKLLNISYTCVPKDLTEDLCRVFKLDSTSQTVNLQAKPCDSTVNHTACVTYNETTQKDVVDIFTHTGTWYNAVNTLCSNGYIPTSINITDTGLSGNASIWSGNIRQRIDVDDIDRNLNGNNFVRCYARVNDTLVRSNCTEQRRYVCKKEIPTDELSTAPVITTNSTPSRNSVPSSSNGVTTTTTTGSIVPLPAEPTTTTTTTSSSGQTGGRLARPRPSSREDSKIIAIAVGVSVGCIVLVALTAVVVHILCKRSVKKKGRKKKKTKEKTVQLKGNVINAQNALSSIKSDTSSDESENETKMAAGTSSPRAAGANPLRLISYNNDSVNETGTDTGQENYAYAAANMADDEEGDYDAMELCIVENDEDHIYAHTMLPLPDMETDTRDVVPKQPEGEAYDVMQNKSKVPENDSAYDHTKDFSKKTGEIPDGSYDVFNGKVKDGVEDTYDHTQSVLNKDGDVNNSMYDAFNGKVKGNEEISNDMYDHTKNVRKGQESTDNIYDTSNDKAKVVDEVDDMYDHTTHVRENQDEDLYDLSSKGKIKHSVDEGHYDEM